MAKSTGIFSVLGALVALGSLTGCGFEGSDSSWTPIPNPGGTTTGFGSATLFKGKVTRANAKVAPISGGTLTVSKDGHAFASDPDRDQVHVVDLGTKGVTSIQLQEGDEPGRVVEGASGTAYVAARRGGVVLAIDVAKGSATRIPVCSAPRGLAFDEAAAKLYVACRSGVLAVVDTTSQAVTKRVTLDSDLRDVVLSGDKLAVTRFKSAEVMMLSRDGELLSRATPKVPTGGVSVTPRVAYRTLSAPGGGVLVGHVDSSNVQLPSGVGAYYGSPCGGSVADINLSVVGDTQATPDQPDQPRKMGTLFSQAMGGMTGPVDLAFSANGQRLAVLATGNAWIPDNVTKPTMVVTDTTVLSNNGSLMGSCSFGGPTGPGQVVNQGEPVAVAFDQNNRWVVQSREPAQLELEGGAVISLASDHRFDTGMAMFHMNTGGGISCNSCHPEAGEDGHTWNFQVGMRRSQELKGGFSKRSPFHWTGDLGSWDSLFDEVMIKRMSLRDTVTPEQRAALHDWLDSVPREVTADDLDATAVERGRVLFQDNKTACATCHGGPDFSDNLPHDVGTIGTFITPSLVGVNTRAPLFHDGCAETLTARFGVCGGGDAHGVTSHLTAEQRGDLVAYMQSL